MRNFIIILFIYILICPLNSEVLDYTLRYGDDYTEMVSDDVTSDFGWRYHNGYNWHKGVDFAFPQYSDLYPVAVEDEIVFIDRIYQSTASTHFKYIVTEGDNDIFGFGHIFTDGHPDSINV